MRIQFFIFLRSFRLIVLIFLVTSCKGTQNIDPSTQAAATASLIPIPSSTATVTVSPKPDFTATPVDTRPVWEIKANWTPANQIRAMLIDQYGDLWTGGPAGVVHWDLTTNQPTIYAIRRDPENTNVVALSQTPDGAIWVGTYGNGFGRFDGTSWQSFTIADGMPGDYVVSQTTTSQGELWFTVLSHKQEMKDSHFGRFNGTEWITEVGGAFDRIVTLPDDSILGTYNYPYHGSFFQSTISRYDGQMWKSLDVNPDWWIDAITVAPNGAIWFATLDTVYRYENQVWKKVTKPWERWTERPRVSSIAVSDNGFIWFGFSFHTGFELDQCGDRDFNNEYGVYRYDGKIWMHFTIEDGLIDNKICAITIDANNNVWFGSYDKGVSRFDGQVWTSYVVP